MILNKVIKINEKPKAKSVIFDNIVDSYPVSLEFIYSATKKYGNVGNITVINLDNKKRTEIKPHQCSVFDHVDYETLDFDVQKSIVDMQYQALKDINNVLADGYEYADTLKDKIEVILRRGGIDV